MRYNIKPFEGVNEIAFGDDRGDIRMFLGDNYTCRGEIDYYLNKDLILGYDENNKLIFIEMLATSDIIYQSHNLSTFSFEELRKIFDCISKNIDEEEGFGVNYLDLGFGASINNSENIKSISVFIKGYWDDF